MLTQSQQKTLKIIKDYIEQHNISPTISEIVQLLHIKSRSLVQRNLQVLCAAGQIRLLPSRRRNIELLEKKHVSLPLIGRIAAGKPIEAIAVPEIINIPQLLLSPDRYLLEVKGDSMLGDNICHGDLVICEYSDTAPEGTIVVALVDNEMATLKRIHYNKEANTITLIPSNPAMLPQEYTVDRIKIQGLYLGLLRIGSLR